MNKEYITVEEAKNVKELFRKNLKAYKAKDVSLSDQEWLAQCFQTELPGIEEEAAQQDAEEMVAVLGEFDGNLKSVNEAAQKGISKERWLADKMQEPSVGMAVNEYGQVLQSMNDLLYQKNMELADALQQSTDGNIEENRIAKITELSGALQGMMPSMDYSHYQPRDLAMSIGKNADVMAFQSAAVMTGLNMATTLFKGESIEADEMVEISIKMGADTSLKVVTAGTLQVAIRKGMITFIPKLTPAGVIANVACVGIEKVKILANIASGNLSMTKGLDQMGSVSTSMVNGLWEMAKGGIVGAKLTAWIPVIGAPLGVVTGFIGGMVGYFGGLKLGNTAYNAGKRVEGIAKNLAKSAVNSLKATRRVVAGGVEKQKVL